MRAKTMILACITLLSLMGLNEPADALMIRDQCNQTSGDGQGHNCPPGDYVLIRFKDALGFCGDWICCPANGDGTYDCAHPVNPTKSLISGALKGALGPRYSVLEGGSSPGTHKPPISQNPNAPIMKRGVESEQPAPSTSVPKEKGN